MNPARFLFPAAVLAAPALLLSAARASHVWVVAPAGGGFTEIQAAVDAAAEGDIVLVKTGTYASFVVANKSLSIVADTGSSPFVHGAVRIRNVPTRKRVLVAGLMAQGALSASASAEHGVYVLDCLGDVRLQDCVFRALTPTPNGASRSGAEVLGSPRVSFARCEIVGSDSSGPGPGSGAGRGLNAFNSQVALYDTVVRGGHGWTPPCVSASSCQGTVASSAGLASAAYVFASNTSFLGGAGGNSLGTCPFTGGCNVCDCNYGNGTNGGHGLDSPVGQVNSIDSIFAGGFAGTNGCGCGFCGCGFCCGVPGTPGQGTVGFAPNDLAGPSRRMSAPHVVRELASWNLSFHGVPGDRVFLFLADEAVFAFQAHLSGVVLTPLNRTSVFFDLGVCDASGNLAASIAFPDLGASVLGRRWFAQPLFRAVNGSFAVGTPNDVVVLDSSL